MDIKIDEQMLGLQRTLDIAAAESGILKALEQSIKESSIRERHGENMGDSVGDKYSFDEFSYQTIMSARNAFRRAGWDKYDTPGNYYFKIFFYFDNNPENSTRFSSGFLSTDVDAGLKELTHSQDFEDIGMINFIAGVNQLKETDNIGDPGKAEKSNPANSALDFLIRNCEFERAEKLLQFIKLLGNINSYSPWYWQGIQGLEQTLDYKELTEKEFKIEEPHKKIVIKTLPDAFDARIGTLLSLYKDICYSQTMNRVIVPANLRRFDMGIYIFNTPILNYSMDGLKNGFRLREEQQFAKFNIKEDRRGANYYSSSKYIELQGCEFEPVSESTAWSDFNNNEGKQMIYNININYLKAYETRYNEFIDRVIGNIEAWDFSGLTDDKGDEINKDIPKPQKTTDGHNESLQSRDRLTVTPADYNMGPARKRQLFTNYASSAPVGTNLFGWRGYLNQFYNKITPAINVISAATGAQIPYPGNLSMRNVLGNLFDINLPISTGSLEQTLLSGDGSQTMSNLLRGAQSQLSHTITTKKLT